jgi:hypothetical protein
MALVKVIYLPDADRRGPDIERMGKILDFPDELARVMVGEGTAVWPSVEDLDALKARPAPRPVTRPAPPAGDKPATGS